MDGRPKLKQCPPLKNFGISGAFTPHPTHMANPSLTLPFPQTLAECTAEMDPDTWNAYHIVSNRARAVCYATRQMQFKQRAEHTVNALVSTAVNQLEAMKMLKVSLAGLHTLLSCQPTGTPQ